LRNFTFYVGTLVKRYPAAVAFKQRMGNDMVFVNDQLATFKLSYTSE